MLPSGILICCTGPFRSGSLCLFGFCLPVSSGPNFPLTPAGGGGLLFGLLVLSRCGEGLVLLSPLRCSGSRLVYMERALRCVRFQPSGVPQKRGTKSCACFLCLPCPNGSGNQELDGRTPSALRGSSPSPRPRRSGACTLCLATTLPADVDHPESQEVFD